MPTGPNKAAYDAARRALRNRDLAASGAALRSLEGLTAPGSKAAKLIKKLKQMRSGQRIVTPRSGVNAPGVPSSAGTAVSRPSTHAQVRAVVRESGMMGHPETQVLRRVERAYELNAAERAELARSAARAAASEAQTTHRLGGQSQRNLTNLDRVINAGEDVFAPEGVSVSRPASLAEPNSRLPTYRMEHSEDLVHDIDEANRARRSPPSWSDDGRSLSSSDDIFDHSALNQELHELDVQDQVNSRRRYENATSARRAERAAVNSAKAAPVAKSTISRLIPSWAKGINPSAVREKVRTAVRSQARNVVNSSVGKSVAEGATRLTSSRAGKGIIEGATKLAASRAGRGAIQGAAIVSKTAARFGPGVSLAVGAYDTYQLGKSVYDLVQAENDAAYNKRKMHQKYGSVEAATRTRHELQNKR